MKYISIFVSLVLAISLQAQEESGGDDYYVPFDSLETKDKISYGFETGVGFGGSKNSGNYFSTYYKPSVSYQLSPKWQLRGGLMYQNSQVNNFSLYTDRGYVPFQGSISEYYAYLEARYQMTERLKVGGALYYNMTNFNNMNGLAVTNTGNPMDRIGGAVNFEYKVGDNMFIMGEVRVNDQYTPFRNNGWGGFGGANMFYDHPMFR